MTDRQTDRQTIALTCNVLEMTNWNLSTIHLLRIRGGISCWCRRYLSTDRR